MKKTGYYILIFSVVIMSLCLFLIFYTAESSIITSNNFSVDKEITVIVDAGHGGIDGGAVAEDGTAEKDINLPVALYLEAYLSAFGVKTKLTRNEDISIHSPHAKTVREIKVSDIHNRMKIIEDTDNCIFVSIHQNSYSNPKYSGAQVFYSPNTTASAEIADCIQASVVSTLQKDNGRLIKKSSKDIFLLYYSKKPAVLVECGFITNKKELELLKNDEYQRKMAFSIALGIVNYINKGC